MRGARAGGLACWGLALLGAAAAVPAAASPASAAPAAPAAAASDADAARFVLIVGVNRSVDANMPVLRYADDDAVRYDELFRSLGARTALLTRADDNTRRVAPQTAARAVEPRRPQLQAAVAALAAEVAAARARGARTSFYFVYAGHGTTAGGQAFLALEDARLTGADIERDIIDRVHADDSHLIVDACYSYFLAYGRGPGGTRREIHGFAPTEGLARRADVGLLLSTTSARESHEWEGFQAGVFSHEVRSGLFGAADFDGDGRVSYTEMAAFVNRANAAIPNERFRPDVFARPPAGAAALVDLRGGPAARHLRIDGDAQAGRYHLEDARGVRLADFHSARGHGVSLLLPAEGGLLYLLRASDGREFEIPTAPALISLAELASREPRSTPRGSAHTAFSLIFSLPFDAEAFVARPPSAADVTAAAADDAPAAPPRPRWRTAAGAASAGLAAVSLVGALALTASAHGLSESARAAPSQTEAAALNERLAGRTDWARAAYGLAAASAVSAGLLFLWPTTGVYAGGSAGGDLALLQVGGRF